MLVMYKPPPQQTPLLRLTPTNRAFRPKYLLFSSLLFVPCLLLSKARLSAKEASIPCKGPSTTHNGPKKASTCTLSLFSENVLSVLSRMLFSNWLRYSLFIPFSVETHMCSIGNPRIRLVLSSFSIRR